MAGLNVMKEPSDDIGSLLFLYSSTPRSSASPPCPEKPPRHLLLFSRCPGSGSKRYFQGNVPGIPVGAILGSQMPGLRRRKPGAASTITNDNNDSNHVHPSRAFLGHLI